MDAIKFADLAKSLAWQLGELRGEAWTVASHDYDRVAELAGPGHERLGLGWSSREGRLRVTGHYPEGTGGASYQARVDPQRGLLTISRDINRRVLEAGYLPVLARQVERKAKMDAAEAERAAWLDQARELFGIKPGDEPGKVYLGRFVKGSGYVQSYGYGDGNTGHLDINLSGIPAQVALDMLKVLARDIESQVLCCRTYGPGHHPDLAVAGCLREKSQRGVSASEERVTRLLALRGTPAELAAEALATARRRGSEYVVEGDQVTAVVSWDAEGLGEYTVELSREEGS